MRTLIATISFLLLTSCNVAQTEHQSYKILFKESRFEVRQYPPAIVAEVTMPGTYSSMSTNGFRALAAYIFGNNQENQRIAMTAPVRVQTKDAISQMQFVMPSAYSMETLPAPRNRKVALHETESRITASIRFSGYANDRVIHKQIRKLEAILEEKKIRHRNDFEYLGYNPPYKLFNRRNEIEVTLTEWSLIH